MCATTAPEGRESHKGDIVRGEGVFSYFCVFLVCGVCGLALGVGSSHSKIRFPDLGGRIPENRFAVPGCELRFLVKKLGTRMDEVGLCGMISDQKVEIRFVTLGMWRAWVVIF